MVIRSYRELNVYRASMDAAMAIFTLSAEFPKEERYSLTDQFRRSSRSVCANIGEAWRKRRYKAAFIAKLSDAETEAGETQVWIEFALKCKYIDQKTFDEFTDKYEHIISQLVLMIKEADKWLIK